MLRFIVRSLAVVSLSGALVQGCAKRTCEEVTADRNAALDEQQVCSADEDCAIVSQTELLGRGCGVLALRSNGASGYAAREKDLAEEAEDVCDEDDSDDLEQALADGLSCAITSIFISDDPEDYEARCEENVCTAVLLVP